MVTNDTLLEEKHVPAALSLPFGQLFFGYDVPRLDVPVSRPVDPAEHAQAEEPSAPTAFQGHGRSLRAPPDVIDIDSD